MTTLLAVNDYNNWMRRIFVRKCKILAVVFLLFVVGILWASQHFYEVADKPNKIMQERDESSDLMDAAKEMKKILNIDDNLNFNVHVFYYTWYGNPLIDGKYYHWNHRFLPHWEKRVSALYATDQRHKPPDDIGSNFYPVLGAYSSFDPDVLKTHMEYIISAGIGVIVLSWYPKGIADDEGKPADSYVTAVLDAASTYGIKVCFHIEPYHERTAVSVAEDIQYINKNYGKHPAFYLVKHPFKPLQNKLPLIYVYDSYQIPASEWKEVLDSDGPSTIRHSEHDALVIGLLVENVHRNDLLSGGFDGFYTYFASSGFSYGSNQNNWKELAAFARLHNIIFIPSVGPGYIDTNIRPWNGKNTRERSRGAYYERGWKTALEDARPGFISITSFNEWHEGSQIEPAASSKSVQVEHLLGRKQKGLFTYLGYEDEPNMYLDLTRKWSETFMSQLKLTV